MRSIMPALLLPLATAVAGTVLYHLAARQPPPGSNPAAILLGAYLVAGLISGAAMLTGLQPGGGAGSVGLFSWNSAGLGVAVVLIEFGFLWMYRSGWQVSNGALVVNIVATLLLALAGLLVFREQLSPLNWLGMAICVIGLALLTYRP
jgi:drug/metabolite transporter (DMT)-like permease